MPAALILAAALSSSPATSPRRYDMLPIPTCGAQLNPKFVTYVPPAEARGGDPLYRPVGATRDAQLAGAPSDALGCLAPIQRARTSPQR